MKHYLSASFLLYLSAPWYPQARTYTQTKEHVQIYAHSHKHTANIEYKELAYPLSAKDAHILVIRSTVKFSGSVCLNMGATLGTTNK